MKALSIAISLFFLGKINPLHQDTILRVDEEGNIIGLPDQFGPAIFKLDKRYLRIGEKEIVFPNCINHYFEDHNKPKVRLSASWYHTKDILPYYLNINISQKDYSYSYNILIDLETLELIHIRKSITKENVTYEPEISLEKECLHKYKRQIKTLNR